jgi:hypothetical protein
MIGVGIDVAPPMDRVLGSGLANGPGKSWRRVVGGQTLHEVGDNV